MIEKLLNHNLVELNYTSNNWEDVVKRVGRLLFEEGKIEECYIQSMIDTVKNLGAYIVIDKGLAMPHGRPEDGVKEMGLSVLTLDNDVYFGNEDYDPVRVVVAICATGNKEHLELIRDLSLILDDENFISKCCSCNSKEELINIFKK